MEDPNHCVLPLTTRIRDNLFTDDIFRIVHFSSSIGWSMVESSVSSQFWNHHPLPSPPFRSLCENRVFNCICKTRRVTRCLQLLQNTSHVRHTNGLESMDLSRGVTESMVTKLYVPSGSVIGSRPPHGYRGHVGVTDQTCVYVTTVTRLRQTQIRTSWLWHLCTQW